jgi:hemoglobin-like flavoprotein
MRESSELRVVDNTTLVEQSFARVSGDADALVRRFYVALFARNPELRRMFPEDMTEQRKKLASALGLVVGNIRKPEVLAPTLSALGQRHVGYGAKPTHFDAVGAALLTALGATDSEWDAPTEGAWGEAYGAVVQGMMAGMKKA